MRSALSGQVSPLSTKRVGTSSITLAGVISPRSSAGANTVIGLMAEPGCSVLCVARLSVSVPVLGPVPPMMPTMSPVALSITTMPPCSCWLLSVSGRLSVSSNTCSIAVWMSRSTVQ